MFPKECYVFKNPKCSILWKRSFLIYVSKRTIFCNRSLHALRNRGPQTEIFRFSDFPLNFCPTSRSAIVATTARAKVGYLSTKWAARGKSADGTMEWDDKKNNIFRFSDFSTYPLNFSLIFLVPVFKLKCSNIPNSKVRAPPDGGHEGVAERGQSEAAPALPPSPPRLQRGGRPRNGQGKDLRGVQGASHLRRLSHGRRQPMKGVMCLYAWCG